MHQFNVGGWQTKKSGFGLRRNHIISAIEAQAKIPHKPFDCGIEIGDCDSNMVKAGNQSSNSNLKEHFHEFAGVVGTTLRNNVLGLNFDLFVRRHFEERLTFTNDDTVTLD